MKTRNMGKVGVSALALVIAGIPQVSRAAAATAASDDADTIIVTGTRDVGVKALDSASPIQVIGGEALEATGATSALDAMRDVLPSFSVSAFNGDAGALIRAARLRGMNPNEVLVLVNGKRRHQAASIIPGGSDQSADSGSNSTDLDMIPVSLIDHVEVLLDGAAAQYGSDAVAGVINIILKSASSGTNAVANAGITSRGDGGQAQVGGSQAATIFGNGFVDVSIDYRHHDFTNRNGINCRTEKPSCSGSTAGEVNIFGVTNGPIRNRIDGSPLSDIVNFGINAEKPITDDVTLYAFATFGRRSSQGYENNREDARAPFYWPDGFYPRLTLNEVDSSITGGVKGTKFGWDWDVSATYGRDSDHFGLINSYNTGLSNPPTYAPHPGLGLDTNFTGGTLYGFDNEQTTVNADIRRSIPVSFLAGPLNVAAGAEFRYEQYVLDAGDPRTYIDGGTQSEAGLTPTDASNHNRKVEAVYADLSGKVIPKLTVDLAGRFENYDQVGVGSTEIGKLTSRYDVTPEFGIRGTVSTGFHAPTLAQSYFSETAVTPTFLSINAPPSSPGAALLGVKPLKPETSKDVSLGVVAEPAPRFHVTADVYQIFLDKQIIDGPGVGGATATQGAGLNGNPLPPGTAAQISAFSNAIDTRTRGLDISADYKTDFGKYGNVKWSLAANINNIAVTNEYQLPPLYRAALIAAGQAPSYLTPQIKTDVTKSSPANKLTLAATWNISQFQVTLRETRYGHADQTNDCGCSSGTAVTPFSNIYIKSAYITDVDLGYFVTDSIKFDIGGNNVFDVMPGHVPTVLQPSSRESTIYPYYTPWGLDGAYFYTRLSASF
jgi:iron complex outermembrane receptor protein